MPEERPPFPPFTAETAAKKVQAAEDAWNTRDPERVAGAYSADSIWRNRDQFFTGREKIVAFLTQKWERELDYALRKNLWAFAGNRIGVRFQYESPRRRRHLVALLRQRAVGVQRRRPDGAPRGLDQRRAHRGGASAASSVRAATTSAASSSRCSDSPG